MTNVVAGGGTLDFDNTKYIDLGNSSWSHYAAGDPSWSISISDAKVPSSNNDIANVLCSKYKTTSRSGFAPYSISLSTGGTLWLIDDNCSNMTSAQVAEYLKGVILAYEKASS